MLLLFSNRPTIYIFSSTRHKNLFKGLLIFIEPLLYNKLFFKFNRSIESRKKKISLPPLLDGIATKDTSIRRFVNGGSAIKAEGRSWQKSARLRRVLLFRKEENTGCCTEEWVSRGEKRSRSAEGRGREKSGGYLSFSGAARKPSEILRLARFEDLSPPPLPPR